MLGLRKSSRIADSDESGGRVSVASGVGRRVLDENTNFAEYTPATDPRGVPVGVLRRFEFAAMGCAHDPNGVGRDHRVGVERRYVTE